MDFFNDLLSVGTDYEEYYDYDRQSAEEIIDFFSNNREERIADFIKSNKKTHDSIIQNKGEKTLADVGEVKPEDVEAFYSFAYDMFQNGRFEDSLNIFRLLVILDMSQYRFLYGTAETLFAMEYYLLAARLYNVCTMIEPENPAPSYRASECYQEVNDHYMTLIFLERAMAIAEDQKKYEAIYTRALLEYNRIILDEIKEAQPVN